MAKVIFLLQKGTTSLIPSQGLQKLLPLHILSITTTPKTTLIHYFNSKHIDIQLPTGLDAAVLMKMEHLPHARKNSLYSTTLAARNISLCYFISI